MTKPKTNLVESDMNRVNVFHSEGIYCIELGQIWVQKTSQYAGRKARISRIYLEGEQFITEKVRLSLDLIGGSPDNFEANRQVEAFLKQYRLEE